jgi:hypothetical protein
MNITPDNDRAAFTQKYASPFNPIQVFGFKASCNVAPCLDLQYIWDRRSMGVNHSSSNEDVGVWTHGDSSRSPNQSFQNVQSFLMTLSLA